MQYRPRLFFQLIVLLRVGEKRFVYEVFLIMTYSEAGAVF